MREKSGEQWEIYRLKYASIGLEMALDQRQETITFRMDKPNGAANPNGIISDSLQSLTIQFKSFVDLERDLNASANHEADSSINKLKVKLEELGQSREVPLAAPWRETLGDFAFLLLRYGRKHRRGFDRVAQTLLSWIGAVDVKTAWRVSFDQSLSFERRYHLLREARFAFAGAGHGPTDGIHPTDMLEVKERELLWWSTLCIFELTSEWYKNEGHYNFNARKALQEASTAYLQMLKDEPRRRDLARFFSECGTDVETEVKRVIFPRNTKHWSSTKGSQTKLLHKTSAVSRHLNGVRVQYPPAGISNLMGDEVIRRTFFIWFLKRYDLKSARRLLFIAPPAAEKVKRARLWFRMLNLIAVLLILIQLIPVPTPDILNIPHTNLTNFSVKLVSKAAPWLWVGQVTLQIVSLGSVLLLAPTYFRLLMPRALFGSLLAWTTIFLTALPDLMGMKLMGGTMTLGQVWHQAPISQSVIYGLGIGLGIFLLSFIFIAYTITQFLTSGRLLLIRTLSTSAGLVLGSFFWCMIFALPIKYLLESGYDYPLFMFDCYGMIPIIFIGTPLAVLFGLIVQLLWEDASLTEPLGEPL